MTARWAEAVALAGLAGVVAGPATAALARARWTAREPVAALVLWQALGLAGGLAILTAELTVAAGPDGPWRTGVRHAVTDPFTGGAARTVGLLLFVLSVGWLLAVLAASFLGAARSRRAHRAVLELLSSPERVQDAAVDVIDAAAPVAYSIPGRARHVVLSRAARDQLGEGELAAVLAHERAHLRQRHALLVQPFVAWERSLRAMPAPGAARRRVEELVEMVCDDAAAAAAGPANVRSALHQLVPAGPRRTERFGRLGAARSPALRRTLIVAAGLLVALPPAVLAVAPW